MERHLRSQFSAAISLADTSTAMHKYTLLYIVALWMMAAGLTSCIREETFDNTPQGTFEALWQLLDERYCFFSQKAQEYGLDWQEVHSRYAPRIQTEMTDRQLFEVLGEMTNELRDGHVNLYSAWNVARYGAWFDNYPTNFSDSLERTYLGRTEEYHSAAGLRYRILDDNIGYIRLSSFATEPGGGNLHELARHLALCDGWIVDVRSNGGGLLSAAKAVAGLFTDSTYTSGYIRHKRSAAHEDFSPPAAIEIKPFEGLRCQKPVCILTNRRTYSAANAFVMFLKGRPQVTIVGDVTGGGSGLPLTSELPNGWTVRFSACPMTDSADRPTEAGIQPDVRTDITSDDYQRGIDTIIEEARTILHPKSVK